MDYSGTVAVTNQIFANVIGGVATVLLGGIATLLWRGYRKLNRFMAEHLWLIATTMWTRDKVMVMMHQMGMPIDNPPPTLPKVT